MNNDTDKELIEKAAREYVDAYIQFKNKDTDGCVSHADVKEMARLLFIAGATWQREQDKLEKDIEKYPYGKCLKCGVGKLNSKGHCMGINCAWGGKAENKTIREQLIKELIHWLGKNMEVNPVGNKVVSIDNLLAKLDEMEGK